MDFESGVSGDGQPRPRRPAKPIDFVRCWAASHSLVRISREAPSNASRISRYGHTSQLQRARFEMSRNAARKRLATIYRFDGATSIKVSLARSGHERARKPDPAPEKQEPRRASPDPTIIRSRWRG
jgi:hypothetical protein